MESYEIFKQADELVKQCKTRSAEHIAEELGIWLYREESLGELLGMYTFRWNHRLIFINKSLQGNLRNMVVAHEIGHDQRHRDKAKVGKAFKELTLFDAKDTTEYEANAFASHILLPSDEVYSLAKDGLDIFRMAQVLGVDENLLLIKINEMNRLGYDIKSPMEHDSRFFRKIKR
ncbi:MAG: ImmA/IrrE family metallo-endopeptidase [Clostridia bacterium]|nr:ImmA/IrrE family metallo-endopeptidase [Clostridia bacterium]